MHHMSHVSYYAACHNKWARPLMLQNINKQGTEACITFQIIIKSEALFFFLQKKKEAEVKCLTMRQLPCTD